MSGHEGIYFQSADKPRGPRNAPLVSVVEVIRVTHVIGSGTPGDPVREVSDHYYDNGDFMFRHEPVIGGA